jgi:endonuclease YncB( thermonuclease family)
LATALAVCLGALAASGDRSDVFEARCIGVTDGDTITVLRDGEQIRVRIEGIDAPELGEPFSQNAKRLTAALVHGKDITVEPRGKDRYGRLLARVYVRREDRSRLSLAHALVEAGLAWHFTKYSSDPSLARSQEVAKTAGIGLWSLPNPDPPWMLPRRLSDSGGTAGTVGHVYHGNVTSKVFHAPWCRYYNCKNCMRIFRSREEAIRAGYRPGGHCKP